MSSQSDNLEKRARALSREEKAALALVLIDELDPVKKPGARSFGSRKPAADTTPIAGAK